MSDCIDAVEIAVHARSAFGARCQIESLSPFVAGVRKRTFVARLQRPALRCLLIVWQNIGQYFPERAAAGFEESQSDTIAPERFRAHTERLLELGVQVPRLLYFAHLASGHAMAFVEWIDGTDYATFAQTASREHMTAVVDRLNGTVRRLHSQQRDFPGALSLERPDRWVAPEDESLAVADVEVAAAAETHPEVAILRSQILDRLRLLRGNLKQRHTFRLLHGELDPSHVIIRRDGAVFLVDIEGVNFGDLESEHAFLRWRYSADDYQMLARDDLDLARSAFYKFRMHVSLVYAGSRLLIGNHPATELAASIFAGNLQAVRTSLVT